MTRFERATSHEPRTKMARRLSSREKKIFGICLITILAYVGYNGAYKPFQAKMARYDQKIEAQKRRYAKNLRTIRKAKAVEAQYNAYVKQFKQSKTNEQIMSALISEIEGVATHLKLKISDLKPKRVKRNDYFNRFSVSLTIDSDLSSVIHFLHTLQSHPHVFDVEEVRFDKGSRRKVETIKTRLVLGKILIP